ncbi:MAG TPA: endonuclease domain-containing protein [Longimicrobiaceae bacterium]|nr:endonuclease domain-containing protein [Longimicrobiaceae bacterium]
MRGRRMRGVSKELGSRARALRREMTPAERQLWTGLRGWGLGPFRRQHALERFVLDFYCPSARLCVEVDGGVHDEADQQERDRARSDALAALGIRVLRVRNEEVLENPRAVLRRIEAELSRARLPRSAPEP